MEVTKENAMKTEIKELKKSNKAELLDLFTEVFEAQPPWVPACRKPGATRALMKSFLDFFGSYKNSWLYGSYEDRRLVCASVSIDSATKPSIFALLRFIIALSLALGGSAKELEVVHREKPKYEEPYLELVLLGTHPAYQKQGLGRKMLHFLYEKAKKENFKGVILVTDKDTPAFLLFLKEGFRVDKEFKVGERTVCWMKLVFNDEVRVP